MPPVTRHSGVVALNAGGKDMDLAAQDGAAFAALMSMGTAANGAQQNFTPPQSDAELSYQHDSGKIEAVGGFGDGVAIDALGQEVANDAYGQRQIAHTLSATASDNGAASWYPADAHDGSIHSSNHISASHEAGSIEQDDDIIEDEDEDYDPESGEDEDDDGSNFSTDGHRSKKAKGKTPVKPRYKDPSSVPGFIGPKPFSKKNLKRHRLSHQETRFLLNEFARDPHPDAAQRGRLAKQITGLSTRQIQVWFQNRRAKLKRMSAADAERVMSSRAFPTVYNGPDVENVSSTGVTSVARPAFVHGAGGYASGNRWTNEPVAAGRIPTNASAAKPAGYASMPGGAADMVRMQPPESSAAMYGGRSSDLVMPMGQNSGAAVASYQPYNNNPSVVGGPRYTAPSQLGGKSGFYTPPAAYMPPRQQQPAWPNDGSTENTPGVQQMFSGIQQQQRQQQLHMMQAQHMQRQQEQANSQARRGGETVLPPVSYSKFSNFGSSVMSAPQSASSENVAWLAAQQALSRQGSDQSQNSPTPQQRQQYRGQMHSTGMGSPAMHNAAFYPTSGASQSPRVTRQESGATQAMSEGQAHEASPVPSHGSARYVATANYDHSLSPRTSAGELNMSAGFSDSAARNAYAAAQQQQQQQQQSAAIAGQQPVSRVDGGAVQ